MRERTINLEALLEEKFEAWERERQQKDSLRVKESADAIFLGFLRNYANGANRIYFFQGTGVSGSVRSFMSAYDNSRNWSRYEEELSDLSDEEIEAMSLEDLVYGLPG